MKEKMKNGLKYLETWAVTLLGLLLFSLGWTLFLIPAGINGGGISGIGALVFFATGFPAGITYFAINAVLVVVAIKKLGAHFGAKTLVNMLIISVLLTVLQKIFTKPIIDDPFLSAVLGGISGGVGLGLVFSQGGSTGGTDIIAMLVTRYRRISPGRVIMYCDVLIIASSWFVFHSAEALVYGYVSMWVVAYSLDAFLNGATQSVQIFIFSSKWEEIRDRILHDNKRGVTLFNGVGGFSKEPVTMIMTMVKKREASSVFRNIMAVDPEAFVSMGNVMGVYGKGFDTLKA